MQLLCIALIKFFGFNIEIIHDELNKLTEQSSKLSELIYEMIIYQKLHNESIYEQHYKSLSTINYLYGFKNKIISTIAFNVSNPTAEITDKNIKNEFYEGFGNDLQQDSK